MAKKKITTLVCVCGVDVSGPNEQSVAEAMERHKKAKHKKASKK